MLDLRVQRSSTSPRSSRARGRVMGACDVQARSNAEGKLIREAVTLARSTLQQSNTAAECFETASLLAKNADHQRHNLQLAGSSAVKCTDGQQQRHGMQHVAVRPNHLMNCFIACWHLSSVIFNCMLASKQACIAHGCIANRLCV